MEVAKNRQHFVLVHGACHGAWTWHRVKPLLEAAGHRVTALDLAASGVDPRRIQELRTLHDYTLPLLEALAAVPPGEKVVLVGHSLGGLNLALAADKFPEKIATAVFLSAFMPDTVHRPSYVLEQYYERTPPENWLDTKFESYGTPEEPLTSMLFGPEFLAFKLYQLCSTEDLELAKSLIRVGSLFMEDLAKSKNFSEEGYGSVRRVFVVCGEDKGIPAEFQRWMIENARVEEVKELKHSDHMAMLLMPKQLCDCLLEIANKHA